MAICQKKIKVKLTLHTQMDSLTLIDDHIVEQSVSKRKKITLVNLGNGI